MSLDRRGVSGKQWAVVAVVVVVLIVAGIGISLTYKPASSSQKTINVWMLTETAPYTPNIPQQQWAPAFHKLYPNATVKFQFIAYNDYFTKIAAAEISHTLPDILYIYDAWIPTFVQSHVLAAPPSWVQGGVTANFTKASASGATYNNTVWGFPTETDTYQLLYNKAMFKQANISAPPATWAQLVSDAKALTVTSNGQITREGFSVITGWDNGVVQPWLSMLMSNGGQLLNSSGLAAFDSSAGLQLADLYYNLTNVYHVTSPSLGAFSATAGGGGGLVTFPAQQSAMVIMANWWEASLKAKMGSAYSNVGVAPIPVGPSGTGPKSVSYSWLWSVTSQAASSGNAWLAWKFLNYLDSPATSSSLTPMGKWLEGLGILPSRVSDYTNNATLTSDPFLQPFINAMNNGSAVSMPLILPYEQVVDTIWHTLRGIESGTVSPSAGMSLASSEVNSFITAG